MASDRGAAARAFPIGLTLAAAVALSLLIGLGVWQLQRLSWKEQLLARIAALRTAPARPIGLLLASASQGEDVDFARADAACAPPGGPAPMVFRYALRDGRIGWRALAMCRLAEGPFDGILLDRGLDRRLTGAMSPSPDAFPSPISVTGVLRRIGPASPLDPATPRLVGSMIVLRVLDTGALKQVARARGFARPAPYFLSVEAERPAPPGIAPAALPGDIPNNHFAYALTWFALAGILGWFYLAMVWRRMSGR